MQQPIAEFSVLGDASVCHGSGLFLTRAVFRSTARVGNNPDPWHTTHPLIPVLALIAADRRQRVVLLLAAEVLDDLCCHTVNVAFLLCRAAQACFLVFV